MLYIILKIYEEAPASFRSEEERKKIGKANGHVDGISVNLIRIDSGL